LPSGHSGPTDSDPYGIDQVIASSERYVLVIEQRDDWDGSERQQDQLVAKVGAYLKFATEGEMPLRYPNSKGREVEIRLLYTTEPPEELTPVLTQFEKTLAANGLSFAVAPLHPTS
jgi:hypothetical protein